MKSSHRLDPVIRIAREKEQSAARDLVQARSALTGAEQRLSELTAYRDEYLQGLEHKTRMGLGAMQVNDYRVFLQRLDVAIQQQQDVVAEQQQAVDTLQAAWLHVKQRLGALDKLVQRKQQQAQSENDHREQLECNEQALTRWRRALN